MGLIKVPPSQGVFPPFSLCFVVLKSGKHPQIPEEAQTSGRPWSFFSRNLKTTWGSEWSPRGTTGFAARIHKISTSSDAQPELRAMALFV